MSVILVEITGSRATTVSIDNPSKELAFTAFGSMNDDEIRAQVEYELPFTIPLVSSLWAEPRTLVFQEYSIKQRSEGGSIWDGTAKYGRREQRQSDGPGGAGGGPSGLPGSEPSPEEKFLLRLSFDSTGGTAHIATSKETMGVYGEGDIPDFQGAIGCNGEQIEGVDIVIPTFKFSYDWYPKTALVTREYILNMMGLTGKVNHDEWMGFARGELLFLGATGSPRSYDDWEIKLNFVGSPNRTNLNVGEITNIAKAGHEYLWVRFADAVSESVGIKVPKSVHIERVYDYGDFTTLGIGG